MGWCYGGMVIRICFGVGIKILGCVVRLWWNFFFFLYWWLLSYEWLILNYLCGKIRSGGGFYSGVIFYWGIVYKISLIGSIDSESYFLCGYWYFLFCGSGKYFWLCNVLRMDWCIFNDGGSDWKN